MPKLIDLSGKKFGRWSVLRRDGSNRHGQPKWLCRCSCGAVGSVVGGQLSSGSSRSCGCLRAAIHRKMCVDRNTKHGLSKTRTYDIWVNMLARCRNKRATGYKKYGARGISVCRRWLKFENFYSDMGECPRGLSIDRINSKYGYDPKNCRWATMRTQQNNRTNNLMITAMGQTKTLAQWAESSGIARKTISNRLLRGWRPEIAVTNPPSPLPR